MGWPTATIVTTAMDAGSDDASQARAEIKQMADNVNTIKDARGQVSGICELDASTEVPANRLKTIAADKGGTGQTSYTVGDILYASAAGVLSKLAAATAGFVLTSNGPGAAPSWQLAGGGLSSGVRMLFQNSAAPTGWTKETNSAYNNVSMRIVTGTVSSGGADDFTTVFGSAKTSAAHTLTEAQIPGHVHREQYANNGSVSAASTAGSVGGGVSTITSGTVSAAAVTGSLNTQSTGGGGSHSHGLTLDLKYRDFILAQKD